MVCVVIEEVSCATFCQLRVGKSDIFRTEPLERIRQSCLAYSQEIRFIGKFGIA